MKKVQTPDGLFIDTLLETISDTVLVLDDRNCISRTGGAAPWAQLQVLEGRTLAAIFDNETALKLAQFCQDLREGVEEEVLDIVLDPQQLSFLAQLGLQYKASYRVRGRCLGDEILLVMQDVSLHVAARQRFNREQPRDPLTRVYNRKSLVPVLNQAIAQSQRYEYNCSLALIDVDALSRINQQFGWEGGNSVLRTLAACLHRSKRTSDFLVRIGEDRFALMLPETGYEQSMLVGGRLVERMAAMEIDNPLGGAAIHFHISVGISSLQGLTDNTEQMVRRASERLQRAKQAGGNRVLGEED